MRAMQEREDKMLSIRSMIERFRETKPTSRQEREQARKQKKVGVRFVRGGREAMLPSLSYMGNISCIG